jgi:signal transduction histidine kinase
MLRKLNIASGILIIVLQIINLYLIDNSTDKVFLSNLFQSISALYAALNLHYSSKKLKEIKNNNYKGWFYITLASYIWLFGAIIFMILEVILHQLPYPSYSDFFYVSFYPIVIYGIIRIPKPDLSKKEITVSYIDLFTMIISTSIVIWNFILYYLLDKLYNDPNPGLIMSMIYTSLDTFLLFLLFFVMLTRLVYGKYISPYIIFIIGCLFLVLGDFMQAYVTTYKNFTSGGIADIGWTMFSIFLGFAGISKIKNIEEQKEVNTKEDQKSTNLKKSLSVLIITYTCLGIAFAGLIIGFLDNSPKNHEILIVGAILVFILVLIRQINSIKENNRLNLELSNAYKDLEESNSELQSLNENISNESMKLLQLNDKLAISESQLILANETKNKFFSIIAHDLKNPISAFNQLIELLKDHYDAMSKDEIIKIIGVLKDSSSYTIDLLNNLLSWSRSQTGRIEFYPLHTILFDHVEKIIKVLRVQAENKEIKIENLIDKNLIVNIDSNMMTTVIRNLLSNAIKFTKNKGLIKIECKSDNKYHKISIIDNGVGMDHETINKLFRIDVKNYNPGTNNERGTGLGLIICKEFTEKHHGFIEVFSEPNQGSTFTVNIPI